MTGSAYPGTIKMSYRADSISIDFDENEKDIEKIVLQESKEAIDNFMPGLKKSLAKTAFLKTR